MDEKVVAESLPIASIKELLQQRVRWMHGAMQLPWVVVVLLFIMVFFYPLLFFIAFTHLWAALGLFFLKISAECIFVTQVMQRLHLNTLRRKNLLAVLPLYEFYAAALSAIMIMFYFLPVKVRWKGRIFQ
jgi:hypothetical protein